MTSVNKRGQATKIGLFVCVISLILTGCISGEHGFHIDFRIGKKLEKDWKGTPVQSFESRFGAPMGKTTVDNVTTMKWTTSKLHWAPSVFYNQPLGPNMYMRVHKPARYEIAHCVLAVSSEGGLITGIKVLDDETIERKSLCQSSFGR